MRRTERQPAGRRGGDRAARLYRWLWRQLQPTRLPRRHRREAVELFHDLYRDARNRGRRAALVFTLRATLRLIPCALMERLDRRWPRPAVTAPAAASPHNHPGSYNMRTLLLDLKIALRTLARRPGPSLAAVLTLAVCIGAITTIFSVVDTVVLRRLPYPEPERLVYVDNGSHSPVRLREWRETSETLAELGGVYTRRVALTGGGAPEEIAAALVTERFLPMLGASAAGGRLLVPEDFADGARVAVLDHDLWQRRWGGDPALIGATVQLDGEPAVVVGIMSPRFLPPEAAVGDRVDAWLPADLPPADLQDRGLHLYSVIARLADGVAFETAQQEMELSAKNAAADHPDWYLRDDGQIVTHPLVELHEATVAQVGHTLMLLLGAVGLMLLIACANIANLQLARGMARAREIAMRGALGASRSRLFLELLLESVALALVGGGLGVALAFGGVELFRNLNPGNIPRMAELAVDQRALLFVLAVSAATGLLFGLLPALQAARSSIGGVLKEGALSTTAGRRRQRARGALVVAEIALALVLLTGAGLLFRSLVGMLQVDPGFDSSRAASVYLTLGGQNAEERLQLTDGIVERLRAIPGVEAAGAGVSVPFEFYGGSHCCWRTGLLPGDAPAESTEERVIAFVHPVTAGYFESLGTAPVDGRTFTIGEIDFGMIPMVVNRPLALRLFGTENAVGKTVQLMGDRYAVIGVVDGVRHYGGTEPIQESAYVPYSTRGGHFSRLRLLVRSQLPLATLAPAIQDAVWSVAPELPIGRIASLDSLAARSVAVPRFLSALLGTFAIVALLLAVSGIYASMLYLVGQRRREMGIRLALGATGASLQRLVLRHGLVLTGIGIVGGLAGGLALSHLLESLLWGVTATDAATYAGTALLLGGIAMAACWLPAFKASRTDPMETLRNE